jgi:formylglycine-generating enzyme required for sulfatase activity
MANLTSKVHRLHETTRFNDADTGRFQVDETFRITRVLTLRVRWQRSWLIAYSMLILSIHASLTHADTAPSMIRVEPGVFVQGSPKQEPGRFDNERPFASSLPYGMWVESTELTQHQWLKHVKINPSFFSACGGACPVDSVNWYEALAFANRRSAAEGLTACYQLDGCSGTLGAACGDKSSRLASCEGTYYCKRVNHTMDACDGYRLLTESEWEYVARSGLVDPNYAIVTKKLLTDIARYAENAVVGRSGLTCSNDKSGCGPTSVGRYQASTWGHYDFHGNLREWVWDGFANYPIGSHTDPRRDAGMERVIRGSSFRSPRHEIRAALRGRLAPRFKNAEVGLRLGRRVVATKTKRPVSKPKSLPLTPSGQPSQIQPHLSVPPGQRIRLK